MKHETDSPRPQACALTRARLPLFTGGDLEGQALADVCAHLGECAACAEAAVEASRAHEALVTALTDAPAALRRPGLWPDVRARLVDEGILAEGAPVLPFPVPASVSAPASSRGAGSSPSRHRLLTPRVRRTAGVVAAAAAIIFLVVLADPLGLREDGVFEQPGGDPGSIVVVDESGETPVVAPPRLRRVNAEDEALLDAIQATDTVPTRRTGAALAGDPNPLGYR